MIISLINQKGGVGKTTVAVNLASGLSEAGDRIMVVDSDPQGSVVQWQSIADGKEFDVIHLPNLEIKKELKGLSRRYDHIVIDSPPCDRGNNAICHRGVQSGDHTHRTKSA